MSDCGAASILENNIAAFSQYGQNLSFSSFIMPPGNDYDPSYLDTNPLTAIFGKPPAAINKLQAAPI